METQQRAGRSQFKFRVWALVKLVIYLCLFLSLASGASGLSTALAAEVLMITWRGKTDAERAFEKRLKELRPNIRFQHIDSRRNKSRLSAALRSYNFKNTKLVYTFGTTATKMTKSFLNGKVPQVFAVVATPVESQVVASMKQPGGNLTGAKHQVDIETQLDFIERIKDFNTIGVWYDPREKQSENAATIIDNILSQKGKKVHTFRIIADARESTLKAMIDNAVSKSNKLDIIYLAPTSSFHSIMKKYFKGISPSIPVFSGISNYVGKGATISIASSFKERGTAAAELADNILSGANPGALAVRSVGLDKAILFIDKKRARNAKLKHLNSLGLRIIEK